MSMARYLDDHEQKALFDELALLAGITKNAYANIVARYGGTGIPDFEYVDSHEPWDECSGEYYTVFKYKDVLYKNTYRYTSHEGCDFGWGCHTSIVEPVERTVRFWE